ncbi:MAG: hypothetical protein J6R79_01170 [Bacteroidaceae bacterium]|nr:hypothetical protein [Bacteroidaceae bacterium]
MTNEKDEQVFRQILQLAYDFSYIPIPYFKANDKLLALLPEVNQMMIDSLDRWFETEGREYSEEHRKKTYIRFCLTLGVGATRFFYQQREPVDAQTLFNIMAAPRGEDAMDEYIEDEVGFWFSCDSDKHSQWLSMCEYCYEIVLQNYDLSATEERFHAGLSAMHAGAVIGMGIIMHKHERTKYEGDFAWDLNTWVYMIHNQSIPLATRLNHWVQMCLQVGTPIDGNIISRRKTNESYEHQIDTFHLLALNNGIGIQTIFRIDQDTPQLVTTMPCIDSSRTHYLIIDQIYEHSNGVEATIKAHFANDPATHVTFYDTEYLINRDQYFVGQCYVFDLYGIAYNASIVPPDKQSYRLEIFNLPPQEIATDRLHSFMQIGGPYPEIYRFRAPVQEIYHDLDSEIPSFFEAEIGIPHSDLTNNRRHDLSIFIPTAQLPNGDSSLRKTTPIEGALILMGKMRVHVNIEERPSTKIHTFCPRTQRGTPRLFTHRCKAAEVGTEMCPEERRAFAKKIMTQFLGYDLEPPTIEDEDVDFLASRHRSMWIKCDEEYTAAERFITEDITPGLTHYYQTGRFPLMVYVSLYDKEGKACQWLKGASYTAKLHYASMLPGQRMAPREAYTHEMLVETLYEAFKNLHTFPLCKLLHKDLYYTSHNIPDPIITREEFLVYIDGVFEANRTAPEVYLKPRLVQGQDGSQYIELTYPEGTIDRIDVTTHLNLITEIHIRSVK